MTTEEENNSVDSKNLILISNKEIWTLFSRGCILPSVFSEAKTTTYKNTAFELIAFKNVIPINWSEIITQSGRNTFPIAIGLKDTLTSKNLKIGKVKRKLDFVTLKDVESIYFEMKLKEKNHTSRI